MDEQCCLHGNDGECRLVIIVNSARMRTDNVTWSPWSANTSYTTPDNDYNNNNNCSRKSQSNFGRGRVAGTLYGQCRLLSIRYTGPHHSPPKFLHYREGVGPPIYCMFFGPDNDYNNSYYYYYDDDEEEEALKGSMARDAAVALVRYVFPLIVLVGTTGNVLSAAVMLRYLFIPSMMLVLRPRVVSRASGSLRHFCTDKT